MFVLFLVAVVWLAVVTEPRRRAAYLTDCQTKGFSAQQCTYPIRNGTGVMPTLPRPLPPVRPHSLDPPAASRQ